VLLNSLTGVQATGPESDTYIHCIAVLDMIAYVFKITLCCH